ncbi:delta-1-pyrroline-5-carboxylate dehydrogenase 1 [Conidiobolus coronatus NRRL 28638]|uniref:Multifunctional fusion protein n=1 Tax=Conidiobolus coronatus (strain ATCC 28846 / CBS 209.66 / NRRL 28638) TaxID=796925 RepID=A0A137PA51_CONC2|nr:delta-1-pyrroline-5-carboxylate dehydrogenase 1 [Conidiobolus coronatus NRRL 28638]|eukprot:KXN71834.1 delta-1-pyrroline-5-carboxylate dehydrogenase 1 [Conidiobolus coronatus NRRL 28638]
MATAQLSTFKLPAIDNEPLRHYAPGSADRAGLEAALKEMRAQAPFDVPVIVNGKEYRQGKTEQQLVPTDHKTVLANYYTADDALLKEAIDGSLAAKKAWEDLPFYDRLAIFMKAADLVAHKYRYEIMAATMLGQGKNAWQAEIDAAAEFADFLRFNCKYAEELYTQQPPKNSEGVWNRVEYRPLEGFVLAVSPFNFTAIGGNLAGAPALMGNVVVWKPAPAATYSNYLIYKIFKEAGLPDGVIQFVPGPAPEIVGGAIAHPEFSSLHFTGSTHVFRHLWKQIGNNIENYKSYPRIVGETGGKNFHLIHKSADVQNVVHQSIRSAFEYQGQKCSALSRVYAPESLWPQIKEGLVAEHAKLKMGEVEDFSNFVTAVINQASFDKIKSYIDYAKESADAEIVAGGNYDDSKGYFIQPTIILAKTPDFKTLKEEIFGPVVTVYVYADADFEKTFKLIEDTTAYALTGAIFAQDRQAVVEASNGLRHAAGNFYINDKCTGAVVGQQPFGGGRASGTNDKAGSINLLYRFISTRTIKESFLPIKNWIYPSNQ